jgi:predicted esterase
MMHRVEPETRAGYWLYLPEDYVATKGQRGDDQRWPIVVTFHGMRPWDDSGPQVREWEQEADRYGFIVIAPDLRTSDSFMQYPLRDPDLSYVRRDERATLAIMDEVCRTTNADPNRVLATSWSCGGYLAHFMVNRHPERFTCLAVRQSNFSPDLLDPRQVPRYRNMRVAIFFGEHDFKICRDESIEAVEWYRSLRFNVEAKYVSGLGHERTPQTAAAFFARTLGVPPKTPPDLGRMVLKDIPPEELGKYATNYRPRQTPQSGATASTGGPRRPPNTLFSEASPPPPVVKTPTRVPPRDPVRRPAPSVRTPPSVTQTPKRPTIQPY